MSVPMTLVGVTVHFNILEELYGYAFSAEHTTGKVLYDGFLTYESAAEAAGGWLTRFLVQEMRN